MIFVVKLSKELGVNEVMKIENNYVSRLAAVPEN